MKKASKLKSIVAGLGLLASSLTSCSVKDEPFKTIGTDFYNGEKVELQERYNGHEKKLVIYGKFGYTTEIVDSNAKNYFLVGDSNGDYVKKINGEKWKKYSSNNFSNSDGVDDWQPGLERSAGSGLAQKMKDADDLAKKILSECDFH